MAVTVQCPVTATCAPPLAPSPTGCAPRLVNNLRKAAQAWRKRRVNRLLEVGPAWRATVACKDPAADRGAYSRGG